MTPSLPTILIPGLICSPRLFAEQLPVLWRFGPVIVGDHQRDESMDAIAERILRDAPARFALAGLSMGGYVCFALMRKAPERVVKLALLDTAARADRPEQAERRQAQIELAQAGRFAEIPEALWPLLVHPARENDQALKRIVQQMAEETGAEAFVRQQRAIMTRPDSRGDLSRIARPSLILVGDGDQITPVKVAEEMAGLLPNSRLVVVPDCGHLSTLERPEAVNEALKHWMES